MNKINTLLSIPIFLWAIPFFGQTGAIGPSGTDNENGVSINSTGELPHPSAMLEVTSDDKGILIPRLNSAQRQSIVSPATGLLVYDTDQQVFFYFNGTEWIKIVAGVGPTGPTGATGATGLLPNGTAAGNTPFWNGTQWEVNNSNIFNNGANVGIGTNTPTAKLHVKSNTDGLGQFRVEKTFTPSGTNDSRGNVGEITWGQKAGNGNSNNWYIYIKTPQGWMRAKMNKFKQNGDDDND